jgi:ArsR family transcriptional regulator, arsenate/arsenite/antimonite-responsive transcriptional repressor / arsenate reductase (thioredoxin)
MNVEQTAGLERRAQVHAALGDVTRLQIIDRLAVSDLAASELGAALAVPSNLLAHHLKVLEQAGLVVRHRSEGDGRRSYLSLAEADLRSSSAPLAVARRVVFVCTANTARSHLAAALWRRASDVTATSAGTHPGERITPGALAAAVRHGLPLQRVAPRDMGRTVREGDLLITVCDRAHEEIGDRAWAHWSVPDPVPAATDAAYDRALRTLATRVETLAPRLVKAS